MEHPDDISALQKEPCCSLAQHTGAVTCLTGRTVRHNLHSVLALKAVSLQSIVHGLISTEPVPFTLEKATRFRLSGLYQVSEQVPSTPSRTALGEYPARHFIKCLQTDAF